jgi:Uncharacterized conserved protein
MVKLSGLVVELLVDEHGVRETIRLFSNPIFFQAFNNIIGMDWDSSGSTTITTAALKDSLSKRDVGIRVVGGKGVYALNVPIEIEELGKQWDVDAELLKTMSRLSAKIDNTALQDGYRLYHHAMIIGSDGTWDCDTTRALMKRIGTLGGTTFGWRMIYLTIHTRVYGH